MKSNFWSPGLSKPVLYILLSLLLIFGTYTITTHYYNSQQTVIYSLDEKQNDQEIVKIIDSANKYVYFAIYLFTKDDIADALIRAKNRGLVVWGLTDSENRNKTNKQILDKLTAAGVVTETQKHYDGIMHIKAIVTDKAYASGSYNWTESATMSNDELLEIGSNRNLHDQYFQILKRLLIANQ